MHEDFKLFALCAALRAFNWGTIKLFEFDTINEVNVQIAQHAKLEALVLKLKCSGTLSI